MKWTSIALALFMASIVNGALPDRELAVGISGVYIPSKISSREDLLVVVNGVFQNGCYKWKRADVNHLTNTVHEVKTIASVSQGMCLMVLIPYQREVSLGTLNSGKHLIRFVNGDGTYLEKTVQVE